MGSCWKTANVFMMRWGMCKRWWWPGCFPHPVLLKPKIYYYLLTSRVIVTDDYLRYLRHTKLRAGQKVVQIWHACGASSALGWMRPLF